MNIDLKLSIYRFVRNYIFLRLIRTIVKHYNDWELAQELSLKQVQELALPGSLIPYDSAVNALSALNLRGGNLDAPIILAIFSLIRLIKKYTIKLMPKAFITYYRNYRAFLEKYPRLKYIEDIIVLTLSVATASIASRNKSSNFTLSYDVINDKTDIDFVSVAEKLGVNLDVCNFNKSFMFEALMSRDLSEREKLYAFRLWLDEFSQSNNYGGKQGLLLCLVAILLFFFLNNYGLFLEILKILKEAVQEGVISNTMLKVILRRLIKTGVKIPASFD